MGLFSNRNESDLACPKCKNREMRLVTTITKDVWVGKVYKCSCGAIVKHTGLKPGVGSPSQTPENIRIMKEFFDELTSK